MRDIKYMPGFKAYRVRTRPPIPGDPRDWRVLRSRLFAIKDFDIDFKHLEVLLNSPQILRLLPMYVKSILEDGLYCFNRKTSDLGDLAEDFEKLILIFSVCCHEKFDPLCVEEEIVDAEVPLEELPADVADVEYVRRLAVVESVCKELELPFESVKNVPF